MKKQFPILLTEEQQRYVDYMGNQDETYAQGQFYITQSIAVGKKILKICPDINPDIDPYFIADQLMFDYFGEIYPFVVHQEMSTEEQEIYEKVKPIFLKDNL